MSGTLTSPAAYVDALGIHAPTYDAVLTYLKSGVQAVYGSDVYLENDSQDGQLVALFAKAIHDANSLAVAVYLAFSPQTAQGAGLSMMVKINGLTRAIPTNSTVDLLISGYTGAVIIDGIATDAANNQWALPSPVTIPNTGSIIVTAVCADPGAIAAPANSVNQIATPTYGWISVNNPNAANIGAPVESDAALRQRQSFSASLPSLSVADGCYAAVAAISGITRLVMYENVSNVTDPVTNVPSHSISFVVEGGDAQTIADTILLKKGQGAGTYGNTTLTSFDSYGILHAVSFSRPTELAITITIALTALAGYSTVVGAAIQAQVVAAAQDPVSGLNGIGQKLYQSRFYGFATLPPAQGGSTYDLTGITLSASGLTADANGNLALDSVTAPVYATATVILVVS